MAQKITPIEMVDRGEGVADLQASLTTATEVELEYNNDGNVVTFIQNDDAGARVATLNSVPDPFGREGDVAISIPAGQTGLFAFANPAMFGGQASITLDAFASTEVGCYRFTKNS